MSYVPSITITLWRRYEYSLWMLKHLSKCVGIEKYLVSIFCEPGYPMVESLAKQFDLGCRHKTVKVNSRRKGCSANILQALACGFDGNDYNIMVEDDILLSRDALLWFEWARRFGDDPDVFTVAAYHKEVVPPERFHTYQREGWFTPWGWATWRDRYEEIKAKVNEATAVGETKSWDEIINHRARGKRLQLTPDLARSQNIGAVAGAYCPSPEWHKENQFNEFWAGMPELNISTDKNKSWTMR